LSGDMLASPVAAIIVHVPSQFTQPSAPMACGANRLHVWFQDMPASVVSQTPPAADPADQQLGSSGCTTSDVTRPAILRGPRHSQ